MARQGLMVDIWCLVRELVWCAPGLEGLCISNSSVFLRV